MLTGLGPDTRVYLALGATDMRKAINGLSILVADRLELDAFSGHLFVFCNRARTIVKILYWGVSRRLGFKSSRNCADDGGWMALRDLLAGGGPKPPEAAAFKRRGGERSGKSRR